MTTQPSIEIETAIASPDDATTDEPAVTAQPLDTPDLLALDSDSDEEPEVEDLDEEAAADDEDEEDDDEDDEDDDDAEDEDDDDEDEDEDEDDEDLEEDEADDGAGGGTGQDAGPSRVGGEFRVRGANHTTAVAADEDEADRKR